MNVTDLGHYNTPSVLAQGQSNYVAAGSAASAQVSGSPSVSVQISADASAKYQTVQHLPQGLAVANNPGDAQVSSTGAPSVGNYLTPDNNPTVDIFQKTKPAIGYTPAGVAIW
jgi:hypothetical protein